MNSHPPHQKLIISGLGNLIGLGYDAYYTVINTFYTCQKFELSTFCDETNRTNYKTKWPQFLILSRCQSVVLVSYGSRQNGRFVVSSCFWEGDKTSKRQNKIPFRRFRD